MINPDRRIIAINKRQANCNIGWRRINGYDQIAGYDQENLRVDPGSFDKITERDNKSFIILKNQIDNYTLNYDDYFGLGSLLGKIFVKKKEFLTAEDLQRDKPKKPSVIQEALNNLNNITAIRLKYYIY